jgi:aspartate-semialdehyde dehydrogenase
VVAEINADDLQSKPRGIASCPNCTTMVLVTGLAPLHRAAGIERMVVSTYQSVSGAGIAGLRELDEQWTKGAGQSERLRRAGALSGALEAGEVWDRPIAGNVIPRAGSTGDGGLTSEEWKLIRESRKILHAPDLAVSVTCVRVPVYVGHAMTANLRFQRPVPAEEAVALLSEAPGVRLVDQGAGHPTPLESAGIDPVLVGRVRNDPSEPGSLDLWITGDNLRKGAALNAVQMAELLV